MKPPRAARRARTLRKAGKRGAAPARAVESLRELLSVHGGGGC